MLLMVLSCLVAITIFLMPVNAWEVIQRLDDSLIGAAKGIVLYRYLITPTGLYLFNLQPLTKCV